jgi:hypothetical protein
MTSSATNDQIDRLYAAALNRTPDTVGLVYWENAADAGWSVPQIAQWFSASPEFIQKYGSLDDSAFVSQLYQNVLGRGEDAPGAAYWVSALASGDTRGNILNDFAQSPENVTHAAALAAVPSAVVTPSVMVAAPVAAPAATSSAATAPASSNPPATIAPAQTPVTLTDPLITGVQTYTAPAAFVFNKATPSDTATLITTKAVAEASTFEFDGYGGQVELSDLTFDGWSFVSKYTGGFPASTGGLSQESIAFPYGGKFVLTDHGAPAATLSVVSLTPALISRSGVDPTTGYSFINGG